jgi:hypothetical protein
MTRRRLTLSKGICSGKDPQDRARSSSHALFASLRLCVENSEDNFKGTSEARAAENSELGESASLLHRKRFKGFAAGTDALPFVFYYSLTIDDLSVLKQRRRGAKRQNRRGRGHLFSISHYFSASYSSLRLCSAMSELRSFLRRFLRRSAGWQRADLRKQGICRSKGPQGRSAFLARSLSPIVSRQSHSLTNFREIITS